MFVSPATDTPPPPPTPTRAKMDLGRLKSFINRHKRRILIALMISLFGFSLRTNLALNGPVEWDEPVYLDAAILYAQDIHSANWGDILTNSYNYEHPIFYKLIYGAVLAIREPAPSLNGSKMEAGSIIRESPFFSRLLALRMISVSFGSAAVFLLSLISPVAGLLLALQTYAVRYTSVIYLEALPLALSLVAVEAYTKFRPALRAERSPNKASQAWLALSAAALGLAVASKYIYGLAGLAILLDFLLHGRTNLHTMLKAGASWAGLTAVFFLLANPSVLADPLGHFYHSIGYSIRYAQGDYAVRKAAYPFWQPLRWLAISISRQPGNLSAFFLRPDNFWLAIDEIFLPFALLGWWRLWRKTRVYALWLVIGLAFLLLWNTKWPQYPLAILAPYCLSAALGIQLLFERVLRYGILKNNN